MADDPEKSAEPEKPVPTSLSGSEVELEKVRLEAELRREQIRADVRKVVYGTMIVGIAVAAFPFFQEVARLAFTTQIEGIKTSAERDITQLKAKSEKEILETKSNLQKEYAGRDPTIK
jgi:hypothetical protein